MYCPNKKDKQFQKMVEHLGEDLAYHIWDKNAGNPIELTRNGETSELYNSLLAAHGNEKDAYVTMSKTFSNAFRKWYGSDEEPKIQDNRIVSLVGSGQLTVDSKQLSVNSDKSLPKQETISEKENKKLSESKNNLSDNKEVAENKNSESLQKEKLTKNNNSQEYARAKFMDGTIVSGAITKQEGNNISIKSSNGRTYTVDKSRVLEQGNDAAMFHTLSENFNSLKPSVKIQEVQKIITDLNGRFGIKTPTHVLLNEASVLNQMLVNGYNDNQIKKVKEITDARIVTGMKLGDKAYIIANNVQDTETLLKTWIHEIGHIHIEKLFTPEQLEALYDTTGKETIESIINKADYQRAKNIQSDEAIAYSISDLLNDYSIEDILNDNYDNSKIPLSLQEPVKQTLKSISNENSRNKRSGGRNENELLMRTDGRRISEVRGTDGKESGDDTEGGTGHSAAKTIEIDGRQRSTTNSLGKPIHGTEEGIRNFWKWFGDSKVVDESGRPLVVYHGTNSEFNEFKPSEKGSLGSGIYFTPDEKTASKIGKNVISAYLKIENPKNVNTREEDTQMIGGSIRRSKLYDGVVDQYGQWLAINPTQIKSATGNDGSFSEDTSDIRYQILGEKGAEALDATDASTSSATESNTRLDNLRVAKEMEATKTPQEIRLATGWEKGVDGLWRYEVADGKLTGTLTSEPVSLSEVWDSEELFKAYPQLKDIQINSAPFDGKYSAVYYPDENKITVHESKNGSIPKSANAFIVHEIQHAIQEIEGFATGSTVDSEINKIRAKANELTFDEYKNAISSFETEIADKTKELADMKKSNKWNKTWKAAGIQADINKLKNELSKLVDKNVSEQEAFDNYRKSAGEVEARNASERMNMTDEERRNKLLSETADVAPEDQIPLTPKGEQENTPEKPKYAAEKSISDYADEVLKYNEQIKAIEDRKKALKQEHDDKQISNQDFYKEVKQLNDDKFDIETKVKRIKAGTATPEDFASTGSATDGSTSSPTTTPKSSATTTTNSPTTKLAREAGNPITEKLRDELDNKMERGFSKIQFAVQEAYQDQHIAVKHFQNVLINNGLKITPINDWYMRSTSLGGMNDSQMDAYEHRFNLPLMKEVNKLEKKSSYRDIENYMMLKHGLERNEWMDRQRLIEWANNWKNSKVKEIEKPSDPIGMVDYDNKISKIEDKYKERVDLINKSPEEVEKHWNDWLEEKINKLNTNEKYKEIWLTASTSSANATDSATSPVDEYAQKIENLNNQAKKRLEETKIDSTKDYSGVTAIEEEVEIPAKKFIDEFESKNDTSKLWELINKSTKNACKTQFENGMIDKETFEDLKTRFKYYIPLRGFDKDIAEDKYDYSPDMGTHFVAPLIKAKGRTSRPETPFAYIFSMNHSAITQSNKNNLNQAWVRLARQDKSGLLTLKQAWYKKIGETDDKQPIWEQQSPDWNADPEQYATNITKFEADMQALSENGEAMQKRGKLDIGLFVKPKQAKQHEIHVYENGTEHVVYINANPKVARAINGDNRVEAGKFFEGISTVNRWMAANFTSRNPLFMATNFERDITFATTTLGVKEGFIYQANFIKNVPVAVKAITNVMVGKGAVNNKYDQYANEFIMNGGKTGYTHIVEIKEVQKQIEDEIKSGKVHEPSMVFRIFEVGNLVTENTTRLATYITSREAGRSIPEAVSNAKEVTVNFNRKGSGALGADEMRKSFLFFNVAVQALDNITKITKEHPWRMAGLLASFVATGILAPMLNYILGGDEAETEYSNLSDWDRQNNWCIWTGSGFVKWSLPQELRVFHSLGDNIYRMTKGKVSNTELAVNTMVGLTDLLPVNPMGAIKSDGKEWKMLANSVTPDLIKPWVQLAINTTYTGGSVYNQYANKADPGFVQASKNKKGEPYAPAILVWATQEMDKMSGGDGVMPGKVSPNPDVINHLMRGYMGGLYSIFVKSVDSGDKLAEGKELKVRDTPLSALYTSKEDIKESDAALRKEYNDVKASINDEKHYISKYKSGAMELYRKGGDLSKVAEYTSKMAALSTKKYGLLKGITNVVTKLETAMKDAQNPDELAQKANEFKKLAIKINNAVSDEDLKAIEKQMSEK